MRARHLRLGLLAGALLALGAAQVPELSAGGYSIFHETIVDLPYDAVESAAGQGAIVLWPLGVIEEHGPQLPLGTDIYNSYLRMKQISRLLREQNVPTVIAPPLYWGINEATGAFGGSFTLRPSTLQALIEDTFASLRKDGFRAVYLAPGHGDQLHNETIVQAVRTGRATTGMRGFVLIDERMQERLRLTGEEPHVLVVGGGPGGGLLPPRHLEIHAGAGETSITWRYFPALVRSELLPRLGSTNYGLDDLREWRKGWFDARAKTPLGYFGDPSSADPAQGERFFQDDARRTAEAIAKHVAGAPWRPESP